jgi:hypothetical protein
MSLFAQVKITLQFVIFLRWEAEGGQGRENDYKVFLNLLVKRYLFESMMKDFFLTLILQKSQKDKFHFFKDGEQQKMI